MWPPGAWRGTLVSIASIAVYCSVAELEPKLFCGTGAGTGAVVSYSGSTASEQKLSFFYFPIMSSVWRMPG